MLNVAMHNILATGPLHLIVDSKGLSGRRIDPPAASWSPDGKWVAVAANQGDGTRLFKVPLDGGKPVRLLDTRSHNPVWSPDGKQIVFDRLRDNADIVLMKLAQ